MTAHPATSAHPERALPRLTKGHGTGNDFLLLADAEAELELTGATVRSLTDRHRGIGADGVIRAVRPEAIARREPEVGQMLATERAAGRSAEWFMDYRNADGSLAQMCGNGLRVFVRYLLAEHLARLADGETMSVATRAGVLNVRRDGVDLAVAMGRFTLPGGQEALAAGSDVMVEVAGLDGARPGLRVEMPNPHVVVAVSCESELAGLELARAPRVDPSPPDGTNVEIVHVLGERVVDGQTLGVARMRVHERGVGETLSCGTGACAVAVAARAWSEGDARRPGGAVPDRWIVQVPGGTLRVSIDPVTGEVELAGPAVLVAEITWR